MGGCVCVDDGPPVHPLQPGILHDAGLTHTIMAATTYCTSRLQGIHHYYPRATIKG